MVENHNTWTIGIKFILLFLASHSHAFAQHVAPQLLSSPQHVDTALSVIQLSDSLDTLRCARWQNGDYTIYIDLLAYAHSLRQDYEALMLVAQNEPSQETETYTRNKSTADRYLYAYNQMNGAQFGYDLKQLVLYVGIEKAEHNVGNSSIVELYVRQHLEEGKAAVFYKRQRIYTLNKRILSDFVMSIISIYFDDDKNVAFTFFGHIHW